MEYKYFLPAVTMNYIVLLQWILRLKKLSEPAIVGKQAQYDVDFHSFRYSVGAEDLNLFSQIIYFSNKLCQKEGKITSLCVLKYIKTKTINTPKPHANLNGLYAHCIQRWVYLES